MSNLQLANGDDHPEAAGKHLVDCSTLLDKNRYDGSAYLAGYVIECVVKTLVLVEGGSWGRGRDGHDIIGLSNQAMRLAAIASSKTAKYAFDLSVGLGRNGWDPMMRYKPEGFISEADAKAWHSEATIAFKSVVVEMKKDGVIR